MPPDEQPGLFLYDVTSSYLEGTQNELAAFGYNRDGKKGKRQIVIGLLCNEDGKPLSIEVFTGNTQDPKTLASRIDKVAKRFGGTSCSLCLHLLICLRSSFWYSPCPQNSNSA